MFSVGSVCMSVRNDPTFESLELESWFLVCRYIFRVYRSIPYMKVIVSRSRSQAWNVIPPPSGLSSNMTATAVTASPFQSGYDAIYTWGPGGTGSERRLLASCGTSIKPIADVQPTGRMCELHISDPQTDRVMTEHVCIVFAGLPSIEKQSCFAFYLPQSGVVGLIIVSGHLSVCLYVWNR